MSKPQIKTPLIAPHNKGALPERVIVWVVMSLIMLEMLSTDIYLNCLPELCRFFNTTPTMMKATVTLFLLTVSLSGLVYGPLSDAFGRRPIIRFGLLLFVLGSIACGFANTAGELITFRIIEGAGCGMAWIVGMAVIKDIFPREKSVQVLANISMVVALAPAVAPFLGSIVTEYASWRACFWILTAAGLLIFAFSTWFLPETHAPQKRPFSIHEVFRGYGEIFTNKNFIFNALSAGCVYAGLWVLLTEFPFVAIEYLGMDRLTTSYYSLLGVLGYMVGSYIGQHVAKRYGSEKMLRLGLLIVIVSTLLQVFSAWVIPEIFWPFRVTTFFYVFGIAFVFPNTTSRALDTLPSKVGSASAALALIEVTAVTFSVWLYKWAGTNGHPLPLGLAMCIVSLASVFCYFRARAHYPLKNAPHKSSRGT